MAESSDRPVLKGALTGAVLGAVGRAAIVVAHADLSGKNTVLAAAFAALIGAVIGAIAGATGRPLIGIVIGAALSLAIYLGLLPVVMLIRSLGAGSAPSVYEIMAVGALAGGIGAFVGRRRRGSQAHS